MKNSKATVRPSQMSPTRRAWWPDAGGQMCTTNQMKSPMNNEPMRVES